MSGPNRFLASHRPISSAVSLELGENRSGAKAPLMRSSARSGMDRVMGSLGWSQAVDTGFEGRVGFGDTMSSRAERGIA
jgi:hypothetical protein